LEEYLEILFIQARDLIISNDKQTNSKIYLIAWLNEDQKQIRKTEVCILKYSINPFLLRKFI